MPGITTPRAFRGTALVLLALVVIGILANEKSGYGQNPGQVLQPLACQPFQQTVAGDIIGGGFSKTIKVSPRIKATIEQIALRIDAVDYVVPAVATVTTSVLGVTSAYYLPIPTTQEGVIPARPLTLMERVQLHADGGTDITVFLTIDGRYANGTGYAQWSVSGQSCAA